MNRLSRPENTLIDAVRRAARQEQFLEVVSAEDAKRRFKDHLDLSPRGTQNIALSDALGRVLAADILAPLDVPPFDRSGVDGFALRASDTIGASDAAPLRFRLNREVIACGHAPRIEISPVTATAIATGGVVPRGADAVIMIEHTELLDDRRKTLLLKFTAPSHRDNSSPMPAPTSRAGKRCCGAGPDLARVRSACSRPAALHTVDVVRKPKVAVLSTGDELVQPGEALEPCQNL